MSVRESDRCGRQETLTSRCGGRKEGKGRAKEKQAGFLCVMAAGAAKAMGVGRVWALKMGWTGLARVAV